MRASKIRRQKIFKSQVSIYIGPIAVWILLFVFIPLGIIVYFSFLKADAYGQITHHFTFENYRAILRTTYAWILLRSFLIAIISNSVCILLGYPVAYWIAKYGGRKKILLISCVVIPSWTCYLIRLYALRTLIGSNGILNNFLLNLNIISSPIRMIYTPFAVIVGFVFSWLPFMILPVYASLEGLNPALLEAALDLGANPVRRFIRVTLPLTRGGIIAGTILVFIPCMGDWLVPHILGGAKVMMVGGLVAYAFIEVGNIAEGASLAVGLSIVVLFLLYIFIKLGGKGAMERIL
jgi:spermidine/putrescine transport system permease protein